MSSTRVIYLLLALFVTSCATQQQPTQLSQVAETDMAEPSQRFTVTPEQKQLYRQAITALNDNRLDDAKDLLNRFQQEKPGLAGSYANLGLIYYKQEKLDASEQQLKKALELNPQQAQALNLMGQIEFSRGRAAESEGFYKRALEVDQDYAIAHYNIALLYDIFFQDIPRAIEHYRKYLDLTGNQDEITRNWLEQLVNSQRGG